MYLNSTQSWPQVWLDEYKQYYYDRIGKDLGDFGNVESRKQLRKNLQCKSFKWYVGTITSQDHTDHTAITSVITRLITRSHNNNNNKCDHKYNQKCKMCHHKYHDHLIRWEWSGISTQSSRSSSFLERLWPRQDSTIFRYLSVKLSVDNYPSNYQLIIIHQTMYG